MVVGLHTVTVTTPDGSATADISCLVDSVSINHGREDTESQPVASTATVEITTEPTDPDNSLPDLVDVGGYLEVTTEGPLGVGSSTRFAGWVTDISLGWDDAGEDTPDAGVGQIIAVGLIGDLGRRIIGDEPFPQESDGDRVERVAALAGVTLDPGFSDPGTVQILARDVDAQPALAVMQEAAESAGGIVWTTRAGELRYADADHRRGTTPALDLDACDVLVTPTWSRNTGGLINEVSIGYGPTPEEGEQPRYYADDPASQEAYGRYGISVATVLAEAADAEAMGQLLLTRNNRPVWILATLPVDVAGLDLARTAQLLGLEIHDLVTVTGLPEIGTAPTSVAAWIEGWSETLAWGVHDLELVVSGYCRTSPPPLWDTVAPALTWDTVGTITWDEGACMGPPTDFGRWADVPATIRWDQLDPATTWDTYTGG